jgi:hypothetical protein
LIYWLVPIIIIYDFLEKITKCKNLSLANAAEIRRASLAGSGHIRPFWPDPTGFGWLLTMARIWQYSGQFRPESSMPAYGDGDRISPDSGDQMLLDSSADWILITDNC